MTIRFSQFFGVVALSTLVWSSAGCAAPTTKTDKANNADIATLLSLPTAPSIDGDGREWPKESVQTLKGPDGSASFQIAGDAANFYIFVSVKDKSPLKNSAAGSYR